LESNELDYWLCGILSTSFYGIIHTNYKNSWRNQR